MNEAGVVVLIEQQSNSVILTMRNKTMRYHPGEICFPGGRKHQEDKDLYHTALRELDEELGIEANRVKLIRKMRPELTLTGYQIQPWLASIAQLSPFVANTREVESVFLLPFADVCIRKNYRSYEVIRHGKRLISLAYKSEQGLIWGATARIMRQLCD